MASLQARLMKLFVRHVITAMIARSSLEQSRRYFDNFGKNVKPSKRLKIEKVDAGGVPAEFISGPDAPEDKVIMYIHGGGFCVGSCDAYRGAAASISLAVKTRLVLFDYRLAPEFPFPAALEDALTVYRWLLEKGISPKNIAIAGDSAGGNLVVATALALRDKKVALPGALVCLSPWADMGNTGEAAITRGNHDLILIPAGLKFYSKSYVGKSSYQDPLISPVYADLTGLPPMLIQVGSQEIILNDSMRLAEQARHAGVDVTLEVWEDMFHIWQVITDRLPESRRALQGIGEFLRKYIG